MNTIAGEFGGSVPHSLSEYYRGGGLVPNSPINAAIPTSGTIAMGNFYGAANRVAIPLVISSPAVNYDVYNNRGPSYVPGISDITVTVNPGIFVGSPSTGSYAMLVPSAFSPGDTVTIINNGGIYGAGGAGGPGGPAASVPRNVTPSPSNFYAVAGSAGSAGGNAVYVNRPVTITNNGTIAGGGGGGGGGAGYAQQTYVAPPKSSAPFQAVGGGGGGGGAGFSGGGGGVGGSVVPTALPGFSGQAGTTSGGGTGGTGGAGNTTYGVGGNGGGLGASGAAGTASTNFGPFGPNNFALAPGGAGGTPAGRYMTGNPFVTWPATGTRLGGVS